MNRADIIDQFGVSVPQASKDLSLYGEKAAGNLVYDKSAKRYRKSTQFKPRFLDPNADDYLGHLAGATDSVLETWSSNGPDWVSLPLPHRKVDPDVLREVVEAIRAKSAIEILYQSMSPARPGPQWRTISPHALGNDGLRWHARAFCHDDRKFKDFILSRATATRQSDVPGEPSVGDRNWHEAFTVELCPNPVLSPGQRAIVEQDFAMVDGRARIPVRRALLYYFQKRLRLDVAAEFDRPQETPVVVLNREAFDAAIAEAMR